MQKNPATQSKISHAFLAAAARRGLLKESSFGAVVGLGMLSHLGSNVLMKSMHNRPIMRNLRADQMATGFRRAMSGKPESVAARAGQTLIGPEAWAPQHAGAAAAPVLQGLSKGRQYRWFKKLRKTVASDPALRHAPIFEDVPGAVNRVLARPLPKTQAPAAPSMLSRLAPAATVAAVGAVEPYSLVHAGLNAGRDLISRSRFGARFMRRQGQDGVLDRLRGRSMPAIVTAAYDYGLSPGALETYRMGQAAAQAKPVTALRLAGLGFGGQLQKRINAAGVRGPSVAGTRPLPV